MPLAKRSAISEGAKPLLPIGPTGFLRFKVDERKIGKVCDLLNPMSSAKLRTTKRDDLIPKQNVTLAFLPAKVPLVNA